MPQFISFIKPFLVGYVIFFSLFFLVSLVFVAYIVVRVIKANRQFQRDWDAATLRQGWDKSTDSPRLRVARNRTMFRGRLG